MLEQGRSLRMERSISVDRGLCNVVLLGAEYPPLEGGIGDYTRQLALVLREQGVAACVLTSTDAAGLPGDPLEVHPVVRRWGWGSLWTIARLLRQRCPDVVHLQYQTGAYRMHPAIHFLPDVLRRLPSAPRLVVTMHDLRLPYLFPKAGRLRHRVVAHLLQGADAVVVTNGGDLARLGVSPPGLPLPRPSEGDAHAEGLPPGPILQPLPPNALRRPPVLIPLGSSLPPVLPGYDRPAWRARLGIPAEAALLGYFGLLHPSKGAELLLQALPALRPGAHLAFVGGGTGATDPGNAAFAAALRDEIARQGLEGAVHWTGPCSALEAAAYLRACDLVVLPFRDGASFRRSSLVGALTLGAAVVTTQPLDPAEVWLEAGLPTLADGDNVALVPRDDAAALGSRIGALLADPGRRARLGQGAARLGQAFRWDRVGSQVRALYEDLA